MKKRTERLEALRRLIANNELSSQEELLHALEEEGFALTQATLSRDMRQLKVAKEKRVQGKRYVLPTPTTHRFVTSVVSSGMLSLTFSGNIGVIRTQPGHAGSVAYKLDTLALPEILGTIAGDDTIFIALREDADKEKVKQAVENECC